MCFQAKKRTSEDMSDLVTVGINVLIQKDKKIKELIEIIEAYKKFIKENLKDNDEEYARDYEKWYREYGKDYERWLAGEDMDGEIPEGPPE